MSMLLGILAMQKPPLRFPSHFQVSSVWKIAPLKTQSPREQSKWRRPSSRIQGQWLSQSLSKNIVFLILCLLLCLFSGKSGWLRFGNFAIWPLNKLVRLVEQTWKFLWPPVRHLFYRKLQLPKVIKLSNRISVVSVILAANFLVTVVLTSFRWCKVLLLKLSSYL